MMHRFFFVFLSSFLLMGCLSVGPALNLAGPVPATCAGIDAEITEIETFVADVETARIAKGGAVALLGAFAVGGPPAVGIAGSALGAFSLSLDGYHARLDILHRVKALRQEAGECE